MELSKQGSAKCFLSSNSSSASEAQRRKKGKPESNRNFGKAKIRK